MFKKFSTYALALTAAFVLSAQVNTADAAKEKFERTKPHTTVTQGTNSSDGQAEIDFVETAGQPNCEEAPEDAARTAEGTSSDCEPDGSTADSGGGTKYSGNKEAGY